MATLSICRLINQFDADVGSLPRLRRVAFARQVSRNCTRSSCVYAAMLTVDNLTHRQTNTNKHI